MCGNIIISYVSHELGWGITNILTSEAQTGHRAAITGRRKNSNLFELFIAKCWMPWTVCVYGCWGILLLDSYFQKLVPTLMAQLVKNLPAMQETQVWCLGLEDPLEEEMATHSRILALKMPWREKPDGLQPMCHRVEHDWVTELACASVGWQLKQRRS